MWQFRVKEPSPEALGRVACWVLAALASLAGLDLVSTGTAQANTVWLFLLAALCLWISRALKPPQTP